MSIDDFLCLDFDFSDEVDFGTQDDATAALSISTESDDGEVLSQTVQSNPHVKNEPLFRRRSSKFMNKVPHSTKMKAVPPVPTHVGRRSLKPNMSRRTRDTMLYAFPSYDSCDSLLFFPTRLSKHLNSGDIPSVAKMFAAHFDKSCCINMFMGKIQQDNLTADAVVRAYEISNLLYPDKISCIRSTQVNGNEIKALGFMKFTKSRALFNAVSNKDKEASFTTSFRKSWEEDLKYRETEEPLQEEKEKLIALLGTGCDLVVFCRFEMTIVIDAMTNKIKSWQVTGGTTSIQEATHDTTLE